MQVCLAMSIWTWSFLGWGHFFFFVLSHDVFSVGISRDPWELFCHCRLQRFQLISWPSGAPRSWAGRPQCPLPSLSLDSVWWERFHWHKHLVKMYNGVFFCSLLGNVQLFFSFTHNASQNDTPIFSKVKKEPWVCLTLEQQISWILTLEQQITWIELAAC